MNSITIEIKAPELAQAILALANALAGTAPGMNILPPAPVQTEQPQQEQPQYAPQAPQQPIPTAPTGFEQQQPMVAQQQPSVTPLPTTAQTYTQEQIAKAATQIVDAGRQGEVIQLLKAFSVQALTQLPLAQYGAFATALRNMGATL